MSRELALQLVKEKRRIDLFQRYYQSTFRVLFILLGCVVPAIIFLSYSIFLMALFASPLIGIYFFERHWNKKTKTQGGLRFFSVINNSNKEKVEGERPLPIAYTVQDLSPPETNRGNYVFMWGDQDWSSLLEMSWEKLFLHDGYAPHKAWQDYTVEQAVVLESGQATTIKFTFHFELTESEFMLFFLEQAFGRGLASFRERILNVLKSQVDRVLGAFGRFEDTQTLFEKVQDKFDVAFSEEEIRRRLGRSSLPINISLTHKHFEFQVCDYRSHGSRYKLWEKPNAT